MEEHWNFSLDKIKDGKRVYYQYSDQSFSINNMPLDETDINRLQTVLQTISQFKGMPQFDWIYELLPKLKQSEILDFPDTIIEFDNNQYLKGIEHIGEIYNAILYKKVLTIKYLPFGSEACDFIIHPYYLKQYNNRWFLYGYNPEWDKYDWNIALDRVEQLIEIQSDFVPNTKIDWNEYFEDIYGVTKPQNKETEDIILYFFGKTAYYIESKPVHGSQKSQWLSENTLEVRLQLIVNYEFEYFILSYADSVKVIQPQSLAEQIKSRMKKGCGLYDGDKY
jgi:hypothetical protein